MVRKGLKSNRKVIASFQIALAFLLIATTIVCTSCAEKVDGFTIIESSYSDNPDNLSIGLANLHAIVPDIEANKAKILQVIDIFKRYEVNMIIFPEFCISGYFWDDEKACWAYQESGVIENQQDWLRKVESKLDDDLQFIIFNGLRKGPNRKFMNSSFVVNAEFDCLNPEYIYDKVMLPGIEKQYTETGQDDKLVIETEWGRFGFTTCYDMCFSQLFQEYSMVDKVDAIIEIASWRGTASRDYPSMNVETDHYYGFLWDSMMSSRAATNQVWVIGCNAVGTHGISGAQFWGGSGLWAPSGLNLIQTSHDKEELLIIHNINITKEKQFEEDDFWYYRDFIEIYRPIEGKRAFTRVTDKP